MKLKTLFVVTALAASLSPAVYAADPIIEMVPIPGKGYEMGKYEVTQKEWIDVMGNNPSNFSSCGDNCPVDSVSWDDIQIFLQKLNAKTGLQYRLPTDNEWKDACDGGSQTKYCGGNNLDEVGWYIKNSDSQTHQVGQKQANGYGLYDMSGNVWEWIADKYDNENDRRLVRGGSWYDHQYDALSTGRNYGTPAYRINGNGFRVARTLP